jgi:hypothetical protein
MTGLLCFLFRPQSIVLVALVLYASFAEMSFTSLRAEINMNCIYRFKSYRSVNSPSVL